MFFVWFFIWLGKKKERIIFFSNWAPTVNFSPQICGTNGLDLVAELGADDVVDYKTANVERELDQREKFDVIFHASGNNHDYIKKYLKGNLKSFYVTLTYPLLKNSDDHGSLAGLLKSGLGFTKDYFSGLTKGSHTVWAFFTPNGPFLEEVTGLMEREKIRPVVGKVFPFNDLPAAFTHVDSGDTPGKVVVQIKKDWGEGGKIWNVYPISFVYGYRLFLFVHRRTCSPFVCHQHVIRCLSCSISRPDLSGHTQYSLLVYFTRFEVWIAYYCYYLHRLGWSDWRTVFAEINAHPEISAHQKQWFFKGGSTQNRWGLMGDVFKGGTTQNRWAVMGDFSKGGLHRNRWGLMGFGMFFYCF